MNHYWEKKQTIEIVSELTKVLNLIEENQINLLSNTFTWGKAVVSKAK